MSFTRILPLLPLLLTGCAGGPRPESGGAPAESSALHSSAEAEIALYQSAITALNAGQLDAAEAEFQRITVSRPGLAGPWLNLALIDVRKKNTDDARTHLAKALERNPKMPQAINLRGYLEQTQGKITQAANYYRQALALKEDYAVAHYNLALVYDNYYQDPKNAVRHYKRYLELTGNEDKKTADWTAELEKNIAKEAKP